MSVGIALFSVGLVVLAKLIDMQFKNSVRARLVLLAIVVICLSGPVTCPLAASLVKSGTLPLNAVDIADILHVPSPWAFFPIVGFSAVSMAFGSEYLNNLGLRDRIYRIVDEIQGFRLESEANRPILVKHPITGTINAWQVQALLDYQRRERAGYLSKFRHSLGELLKDIAAHGLGTERELIAVVFDTPDIPSVERQLFSLAERIDKPWRTISWHAVRAALLLALLPTIIWTVLALASP